MRSVLIFLTVGLMTWLRVANVVAQTITTEPLPALEHAVSSNAVALVEGEKGVYLFSFLGLGSGKTWQDISSSAFVLNPGATSWTKLGWTKLGWTKDHRGLLFSNGWYYLVGGMHDRQTVTADVYRFRVE